MNGRQQNSMSDDSRDLIRHAHVAVMETQKLVAGMVPIVDATAELSKRNAKLLDGNGDGGVFHRIKDVDRAVKKVEDTLERYLQAAEDRASQMIAQPDDEGWKKRFPVYREIALAVGVLAALAMQILGG